MHLIHTLLFFGYPSSLQEPFSCEAFVACLGILAAFTFGLLNLLTYPCVRAVVVLVILISVIFISVIVFTVAFLSITFLVTLYCTMPCCFGVLAYLLNQCDSLLLDQGRKFSCGIRSAEQMMRHVMAQYIALLMVNAPSMLFVSSCVEQVTVRRERSSRGGSKVSIRLRQIQPLLLSFNLDPSQWQGIKARKK